MAYPPDFPAKEDILDTQHKDLSPSATTVSFDPVLPLLRVPVPAGENDDPSKGPFVLAFRDEVSWRRAWRSCEEKICEQCEAVARKGCSITASRACSPPWWKAFFPMLKHEETDTEEAREACGEKAMMACVAAAKVDGAKFAKETCREVFGDARIAAQSQSIDPKFTRGTEERVRLSRKIIPESCSNAKLGKQPEPELEGANATNFRGRELMNEREGDETPAVSKATVAERQNWLSFVDEAVLRLRKAIGK